MIGGRVLNGYGKQPAKSRKIPGDWNFAFGSVAPTLYFLGESPIKSSRFAGKNRVGQATGNTRAHIIIFWA